MPRPEPQHPNPSAAQAAHHTRWQSGDWPLWLFFLAVFLFYLKDVPTIVVAGMAGGEWLSPQLSSLISIVSLLLLALLAAVVAPGKLSARLLGLRRAAPVQALGWTVAALVALYVPVYLGNVLAQAGSQDVAGLLGEGTANPIMMLLAMSVIGPVAEELAYRAVLFRAACDGLARWLPPKVAAVAGMVASALVFMLVHVGAPAWQMLAYFAFGLVLAAAYWHTGSLLATLLPHLLNNAYVGVKMALALQPGSTLVVGVAVLAPLMGLGLAWGISRMMDRRQNTAHAR